MSQSHMPTLPIFPGDSRISKALPKISRTDLSPEFLLISTQTTTPPKERKKILPHFENQMLTSMKCYRAYLFFCCLQAPGQLHRYWENHHCPECERKKSLDWRQKASHAYRDVSAGESQWIVLLFASKYVNTIVKH